MGMGPARPGPAPHSMEPWLAPRTAPGPQFIPGHSASAGVGDLLGSVVLGKSHGPLGGREGFQFPGHEPRDGVNKGHCLEPGLYTNEFT